jgi:hypothetical protein
MQNHKGTSIVATIPEVKLYASGNNDTDPPSVLWEPTININLFVTFMFFILPRPLQCGY